VQSFHFEAWFEFLEWLQPLRALKASRRDDFLWRGQADATDGLVASIDRSLRFPSIEKREAFLTSCVQEFARESYTLGLASELPIGLGLELFARHHGLPSALLDFTLSPYIAAFFAFAGHNELSDGDVAIWQVDRARLDIDDSIVEVIDELDLLRFNPRALRQRGVFLRINQPQMDLAEDLPDAVSKISMPARQAKFALRDLESMTINDAYLFDSLDGAAKSALTRIVNAGSLEQ